MKITVIVEDRVIKASFDGTPVMGIGVDSCHVELDDEFLGWEHYALWFENGSHPEPKFFSPEEGKADFEPPFLVPGALRLTVDAWNGDGKGKHLFTERMRDKLKIQRHGAHTFGAIAEQASATLQELVKAAEESREQVEAAKQAEDLRAENFESFIEGSGETFSEKLTAWDDEVKAAKVAAEAATTASIAQTNAAKAAEEQRETAFSASMSQWTQDIIGALGSVDTARTAAMDAARDALDMAEKAEVAADGADEAAGEAKAQATAAQNAANAANASKASADQAAAQAQAKATLADQNAAKADQAAQGADAAKASADAAAKAANDAATKVKADYATDKAAWSKQTADAAKQATDAAEDAESAAQEARDAADAIPELMQDYAKQTELKAVNKVVERNDARLDIVESVLSDGQFGWELVESEAYEVPVPRNAVTVKGESHSFADLVAIEGKTVNWNQLAKTVYSNDFAFSGEALNYEAGHYYANVTTEVSLVRATPGHKYAIFVNAHGCSSNIAKAFVFYGDAGNVINTDNVVEGKASVDAIVNATGDTYRIVRLNSVQMDRDDAHRPILSATISVRIVDLTATPSYADVTDLSDHRIAWVKSYAAEHQEFNEGELVNADIVKVESVGKNLAIESDANGRWNFRITDKLEAGTYTLSWEGGNIEANIKENDGAGNVIIVAWKSPAKITLENDASLYVNGWAGVKDMTNIQVERGDVATAYSQHGTKDTIDLPQLNLRSAGSVADRADFLADKVERRVGVVDLGTLNWTSVEDGMHYAPIQDRKNAGYGVTVTCAKYNALANSDYSTATTMPDKSIRGSVNTSRPYVYVKDSDYQTASAFKAAMQGVLMYFELAEPTTEPLDVPRSFVQAEPGGVIRYANEDAMPVPNAIQFPVDRLAVM